MLKMVLRKRLEKNPEGHRHLEIDPEGDQGPTWTVQPVQRLKYSKTERHKITHTIRGNISSLSAGG
jgi:hypothetical protein